MTTAESVEVADEEEMSPLPAMRQRLTGTVQSGMESCQVQKSPSAEALELRAPG
jgi:hypothetical protein